MRYFCPRSTRGLLRRQNHDDLTAFHAGLLLDLGQLFVVLLDSREQGLADFLVDHFAAAVPKGDFHFVAFFDEAAQGAHFHIVVVPANRGANFEFLNFDDLLLFLRFILFLLQLVLVLADVENFANGRLCAWGDFHQVVASFVSFAECGFAVDDAEIFTFKANQADGAGIDLVVDARPIIFGRLRSILVWASYVSVSCCSLKK